MDEAGELSGEDLTDAELEAVVRVVRALVHHDLDYLREIGAYEPPGSDPYMWTRHWRLWDQVDLVMPPGDPKTWILGAYGERDPWLAVDVQMWTEQEGLSDLILQIDLKAGAGGKAEGRFSSLHVQ
jgi:hypothetical protein